MECVGLRPRSTDGRVVTQMHYARRGEVTAEMAFVAAAALAR